MSVKRKRTNRTDQEGSVLVVLIILVVATMAALSLTMVTRTQSTQQQQRGAHELQAARFVAEAGLNAAYVQMSTGGDGDVGSSANPIAFGGGQYWVESSEMAPGVTQLLSRGRAQGGEITSELVLSEQANAIPNFGIFGDEWLTFASNAFVDSYNSSLGSYASQQVNAVGNDKWANENGHSGSNGNIGLSQNAGIHGDATPGMSSVTTVAGNSAVSGSTLPIAEAFVMPTISVPSGTSMGDLIVTSNQTLSSGTYFFDTLEVKNNKSLTIEGPVTIVVSTLELLQNSEMLIDSAAGGAEIYVLEDFVLHSNVLLSSLVKDPADVLLSILANNIEDPDLFVDLDVPYDPDSEVAFDSNSAMYGTIIAPNAYININSNFELWGSLMSKRLHLDSNSLIHFDENLFASDSDTEKVFDVVGWIETPGID